MLWLDTGAAGAYIAARDGYFTAAGLHVKIVAVTSSAAVMALGSYPLDVTVLRIASVRPQ